MGGHGLVLFDVFSWEPKGTPPMPPPPGNKALHIYQNHADCEGDILFEVVRR